MMATPTTLALDIPTILALTLLLTSVAKAILEVWVTPDQRLHDPLVQLVALCIGVGWSFAFTAAYGPAAPGATLQAVTSVILGLAGSTGAIGVYHMSTALTRTPAATPDPPQSQDRRLLAVPAEAQVSVLVPPRPAPSTSGAMPVSPVSSAPTTPPTVGAEGTPPP